MLLLPVCNRKPLATAAPSSRVSFSTLKLAFARRLLTPVAAATTTISAQRTNATSSVTVCKDPSSHQRQMIQLPIQPHLLLPVCKYFECVIVSMYLTLFLVNEQPRKPPSWRNRRNAAYPQSIQALSVAWLSFRHGLLIQPLASARAMFMEDVVSAEEMNDLKIAKRNFLIDCR